MEATTTTRDFVKLDWKERKKKKLKQIIKRRKATTSGDINCTLDNRKTQFTDVPWYHKNHHR